MDTRTIRGGFAALLRLSALALMANATPLPAPDVPSGKTAVVKSAPALTGGEFHMLILTRAPETIRCELARASVRLDVRDVLPTPVELLLVQPRAPKPERIVMREGYAGRERVEKEGRANAPPSYLARLPRA